MHKRLIGFAGRERQADQIGDRILRGFGEVSLVLRQRSRGRAIRSTEVSDTESYAEDRSR